MRAVLHGGKIKLPGVKRWGRIRTRIKWRVKGKNMEQSTGRESRKDNDLFFTCSLIDYIGKKTKNTRADVVNALGKKRLEKIYDLADVYHSDNIDRVSDDFIEECKITKGNFDNVGELSAK